ncbi:hypothetical protein SAMN04487965_3013 [Microbulbifer donghaiensis]|uniref:Peptidase propeptide and YPEB domain-containing protein n=1 Tax=Microbulbifer donghaiensis TaxID=494016 RepID=A0A1M5FYF8_9GAMM|nr:hypothetical protein [Microbulbifer donghaiensis]SHF96444.1 hypothetical protein SAMN04487965_3013 [Microbulbifer donghaiensis]
MSFFATVLLVNALTFPIPADLNANTPAPIYDSPDLYGDEPSVIALDLPAIRGKLHSLGFRPITEVRFIGGRWKIKARYGGKKRALEVDPDSGLIISDRPDRS